VWWPAHDDLVYRAERLPVWDPRAKAFTDPATGTPLQNWEQACEELAKPAHVVRFGEQVHVKGILGGSEEAGRHIGYLMKYLTKPSARQRDSTSTPPTPNENTSTGCTPNSASRPALLGVRDGYFMASSPEVPGTL
jgi:hypothetical protein